ncbi:MAG: hypothetical protein K0R54_5237, partial [Clostridiaceae bacterium]|nr:hypothetical protein [Clostridiaceae bacterium]
DMEAIFITKDKEIYVTEGLKEDLILFEGNEEFITRV